MCPLPTKLVNSHAPALVAAVLGAAAVRLGASRRPNLPSLLLLFGVGR